MGANPPPNKNLFKSGGLTGVQPPPHPKFRGVATTHPPPPPRLAPLVVSLYKTIIFNTKFYQSMHHNVGNMS